VILVINCKFGQHKKKTKNNNKTKVKKAEITQAKFSTMLQMDLTQELAFSMDLRLVLAASYKMLVVLSVV